MQGTLVLQPECWLAPSGWHQTDFWRQKAAECSMITSWQGALAAVHPP